MKSNARAYIALCLGIMLLTIAILENQFDLIPTLINELSRSITGGMPAPIGD